MILPSRIETKDITWFDGSLKENLLQKFVTNDTSIRTKSYDNTFSVMPKPKPHPNYSSHLQPYDILTNMTKT